jgi:hypothetical protein
MAGGAGSDDFEFHQGDSPTVTALALNGDNVLSNGDTFTFSNGVDRISDFAAGEEISLFAPSNSNLRNVTWMGSENSTPATSTSPANGLATDQAYFMVQGGFNGTTFTANTTGADTLVVYDGDSSAGVTQTGIVLSGVTLVQLNAYTYGSFINHI